MEIQNIIGMQGKIEGYQATFVSISVERIIYRYDFIGKKEFKLNVGEEGSISYLDQHPLLMNYNEPWASTYINSKPKVVEKFIKDIHFAIDKATSGWRHWTIYITNPDIHFTFDAFVRNVREGNGILLKAPITIINAVVNVCNEHETLTKTFESPIIPKPNSILMVGNSYIIAEGFKKHMPY